MVAGGASATLPPMPSVPGRILRRVAAVTVIYLGSLWTAPASGQWPRFGLTPYASGLTQPLCITHAGDGSGRLFVVEQPGRIRVVANGSVAATPFLDLTGQVLSGGEQGLLSVAFPPGFATNRHFYVNYTRTGDGATVISRFSVSGADPNVANPASEEILLLVPQPAATHNGGQLAFGPLDGYLYIGMGDGGGGFDPGNRAQNSQELLGKILRIGVEPPQGTSYSIPPTNPFVTNGLYRPEIWALGLRNPWRFSFDPLNGDMYIGDVGQNLWEEIDYHDATSPDGQNFGWRIMEGFHCTGVDPCVTNGLTLPIHEYGHNADGGSSVIGGYVYRGSPSSLLYGIYLYGDFTGGKIWGLRRQGGAWTNQLLYAPGFLISSFGTDQAGNLYAVDYGGSLYRFREVQSWPAALDVGGGWRWLPWFGYFFDFANGWIWHLQHGWMFASGSQTSAIWFYTPDMGWLWSNDQVYPYLWRAAESTWLWYLRGSSAPRWFFNYGAGSWEPR